MQTYDFIALGGGNAGLTAAQMVAAAGQTVALVDPGPVGGLCSLNGCNPKKVLVRSSQVLDEVRRAADFGIDVGPIRPDWSRVIDRKETFTAPVTEATQRSLKQAGIRLIQGSPRFVAPDAIEVNGETLRFQALEIATGSTPRPLSFPGADLLSTSDDLLSRRSIPSRLVIVGAGVVAFELGHVYVRFGATVTMLNQGSHPLEGQDADLVAALVEFSRSLGISVVNGAEVKAIQRTDSGLVIEAQVGDHACQYEADVALNAAGRVPAIDSLDLGAAHVERDAHGVVVNQFLRSPRNPRVFAAGDAHGRFQLSPIASYEGRLVGRNHLGPDVEPVCYDAIPMAVYTTPPLASVGLTEQAARAQGRDVRVTLDDMHDYTVYRIAGKAIAKAKLITDRASRQVLGAHLLGEGADEAIHVFALAKRFELPTDKLSEMVYAYPTFSSAFQYPLWEDAQASGGSP